MFNALITSSIDPNKVSLTVKGFIVMILPIVLAVTGITSEQANPIIDLIVQVVFLGSTILSSIMMLYGLIRKIKVGQWNAK
jgi:hypothetical protein